METRDPDLWRRAVTGVSKPHFQLIYRGIDISSELAPMVTSVTYTDLYHGEVDEIDVTVQDRDGRWKGSWKPEAGDTMQLTIFDGRGGVLPCGSFELDEPDAEGDRGGDRMVMRGLAAPISKELRTEKTRAFEKQSLSAIVGRVAGEAGLSLEGQIDNLTFERITQRRERDLEFLTRLAEDTGHYFSVRGSRAIFTNFASVDGQNAALTVRHAAIATTLVSYKLREQTHDTYSSAKASYLDRDRKETVTAEETDAKVRTGDTLKISGERVESPANARALAKSRLHFANRKRRSGSIEMVGEVRLVAGAVIDMADFGQYSGRYLVDSSTHTMTRGGYTSSAELKEARG